MNLTFTSIHCTKHVNECTSLDNQNIVFIANISIYYFFSLYRLTSTLTSMKNTIMNARWKYSQMLRTLPQCSIINIHANNLSLWNWWKHRWKISKFQEYQIIFFFLPNWLFFMSLSPPLTSITKASLHQFNSPSLQPAQVSKDIVQDQIPRVLNDSSHHRYSPIWEASTFSPI